MILIIILIVAFVRRAGELGLNKFAWGAIGFASYFVSQLLFGVLMYLAVDLMGGTMDESSTALELIGVAVGGLCAYVAYQRMPKYAAKERNSVENDLLDDDLFL